MTVSEIVTESVGETVDSMELPALFHQWRPRTALSCLPK